MRQPHEVVRGGGQLCPGLVARQPDEAKLMATTHGFNPTEDFFHSLPPALAPTVAGMARRSPIDRAFPPHGRWVLRDVGRDASRAAAGHESSRVVRAITGHGSATARWQAVKHLQRHFPFRRASGAGHLHVDHQSSSVVHQYVPGERQTSRLAVRLTRQPSVGVRS